ncbi:MAG TPA: IS1595 family transposase [Phycisphaerales bacterium]|nr:IS1595 family transposase [Phycisphaerales bacterium]
METPKTLLQAARYFADLDICEKFMREIKWHGDEPACPHCGSKRIGEIKTRRLLRCKDCRKQFSSKVGTIFEDSPLGLDKWFVAVWAIANCKNGISSHELARSIGVRQPTAWFMLHRIRTAMECGTPDKFDGTAEMDTTYIGGTAKNMHTSRREKLIQGRGAVGKTPVHGILQRGTENRASQINAAVIGTNGIGDTITHVKQIVKRGSQVCTDEARAYDNLSPDYVHQAVDHSVAYVNGNVHCNGVENFWSLFKRTIHGTYVAIAPFHLCRYVAEQVFRFNYRELTDSTRFWFLLNHVFNKRLTYRTLAGIDDAGFMGKE